MADLSKQQNGLTHSTTSITSGIRDKVISIAQALVYVNDLLPYKLDGMEIERWAKTILLDRENTRVGEIEFLIKCFRNESLMWDRTKGIQNIFLGLKKIEYSNGEYKLLRDIW